MKSSFWVTGLSGWVFFFFFVQVSFNPPPRRTWCWWSLFTFLCILCFQHIFAPVDSILKWNPNQTRHHLEKSIAIFSIGARAKGGRGGGRWPCDVINTFHCWKGNNGWTFPFVTRIYRMVVLSTPNSFSFFKLLWREAGSKWDVRAAETGGWKQRSGVKRTGMHVD